MGWRRGGGGRAVQTEINTKEMGGRPKPTPSSWHLPQRSFAVISSSAIGRRVTRIEQSSCELRGLALAGDSAEAEPMSASSSGSQYKQEGLRR